MSILNIVEEVAVPTEDFRHVEQGGGGASNRKVVGKGNALVVLTGVVEIGNHNGEFQGKKFTQDEVELTFHIVGGFDQDAKQMYVEEGGKPIELTGLFPLGLQRTSKSKAMKAFQAMNYAKDPNKSHFKDFLGQLFSLDLTTKIDSKGKLRQVVDLSKLTAPLNTETGEPRKVNADYNLEDLAKLFIWNVSNEEHFRAMWKTIENLDTYEKDGVTYGLDFTCDKIRKANNYRTAPWYSYIATGYTMPESGGMTPDTTQDESMPLPSDDDLSF